MFVTDGESVPRTSSAKLGLGPCDERRGAAARRQLERLAELLASLGAPVVAVSCWSGRARRLRLLEALAKANA